MSGLETTRQTRSESEFIYNCFNTINKTNLEDCYLPKQLSEWQSNNKLSDNSSAGMPSMP